MKHKISESQINIIEKWLHNESFCKAHLGLEGAQFLRKVIYDGGYTDTSKKLLSNIRGIWIECLSNKYKT